MIYTILACFIKRTPIPSSEAVYRDELIIKKPPLPPPTMKPPSSCKAVVKKSVRFADSEPAVVVFGDHEKKDDDDNNLVKGIRSYGEEEKGVGGGIRVKVKMTKEEAARLLSKCKHRGQLDFNDVARELVALPINRVSVVSTTNY